MLPALIALVALAVIVVALIIITSSGSTTNRSASSSSKSATSARSRHHRVTPTFNPASVTVAVLNGTGITNLAKDVANKLTSAGYQQGNVGNAAVQTHTTTIVAYLPGHQADAQQVALALKLPSTSVQLVDPGTQSVACPPPGACAADVVVTIGQDLQSAAPTTTG